MLVKVAPMFEHIGRIASDFSEHVLVLSVISGGNAKLVDMYDERNSLPSSPNAAVAETGIVQYILIIYHACRGPGPCVAPVK